MKILGFQPKTPFHILSDCSKPTKEQRKYLQKCKPMICTPIRGQTVQGNYHLSIQSVSKWGALLGVNIDIQMLMNCSYIEQGRNVLANTFYNSDCTHLIFIDSDNGFVTNHFFELLLAQKDIVGGVYTKRKINWDAVHKAVLQGVPVEGLAHCAGDFPMHALQDHEIKIGVEPQKVLTLPTGFLCISRKTFDTYVKAFPDRKTTPNSPGHYGIQFFQAGTFKSQNEKGETVVGFDSEDNVFCKDMLTLGINTWVCPWMQISHHGEYLFDSCFACSSGAYVHFAGWQERQEKAVNDRG